MSAAPTRRPAWILAALIVLLPFEPRWPTWRVAGLQLTVLELAAACAMLLLTGMLRGRLVALLRRPPLPVACLTAFALAHLVSAGLAPEHRGASLAFSLRMAAAAVLAALVAASGVTALMMAFRGLVVAAAVVSTLALLEALGLRALDPFLDLFRAAPFLWGGARRASGASENPNLAAALLAHGLVVGAGLASRARRGVVATAGLTALLSTGLLFTYSRGGLLSALVGIASVAAALRPLGSSAAPTTALGTLGACLGAFTLLNPAVRERLWLAPPGSTLGASYQPVDTKLSLATGERRPLTIHVTNTGSRLWQPEDGLGLACAWYSDTRQLSNAGCATPLREIVAPGERVTLEALVQAPASPGRYFLVWELGGTLGRFSSFGVPPVLVMATVGEVPSHRRRESVPQLHPREGRLELWRLAVRMWSERPWLGFGPDNFRRLHSSYAGQAGHDPWHPAPNTFLEVVATTGVLGLGTLLATLVASARAAGCALRRPGPEDRRLSGGILLGLLAGFAAHGSVDYLLGFTGHYLLFGFVVGACAASASAASSPSA